MPEAPAADEPPPEDPVPESSVPDDSDEPEAGEDRSAPAETRDAPSRDERTRKRLATAFGWVAGGSLGLLVNYALLRAVGEGYPTTYTTFGFFLAGAFGGMFVADRLGPRGFKPLGVAAGILLALFVVVVLASFIAPAGP